MIRLLCCITLATSDMGSVELSWADVSKEQGVVRAGDALEVRGTGQGRSIVLVDYLPAGSFPEKDKP